MDANRAVQRLKEDEDYTIDAKTKSVSLTEEGSKKVENILHIKNLYDIENTVIVHHLQQALSC